MLTRSTASRHRWDYIEEFFRVLRPGGVAVFQVPAGPVPNVRPSTRRSIPLPRKACRLRARRPVLRPPRESLAPPGDTATMGLPVEAPDTPGTYVLELDMVQENVRWFAEAGAVEGLPAFMEMHGIPRAEVEMLIAQGRGLLLAVDDDDAPGPSWTGYRYIAQRRPE